MKNKRKIIIDTDPGHDDALAILLMEKSEMFDIKAITTVAGNSSIQNTTNNARFVLDLIESKTPLYSGANKPIARHLVQADVHGKNGLDGAEITKTVSLTGNAVDKIIEIAHTYPGELSLLVLGPCTNIAQALLKDLGLVNLLSEIVIMGGAIEVPGNKNRVAEFNIYVDPEAADVVFRSPVKKTLVTLDACNHISFKLDDFEVLSNTNLYEPLISMMRPFLSGIQKYEKDARILVYDALAAYYLVNQKAYVTTEMDIQIETKGNLTRGMTVTDRRKFGNKMNNVNVVTKIDESIFKNDFFAILK